MPKHRNWAIEITRNQNLNEYFWLVKSPDGFTADNSKQPGEDTEERALFRAKQCIDEVFDNETSEKI